jgi:hypothetical protein
MVINVWEKYVVSPVFQASFPLLYVYKLFSGQGFSKWGHCPQTYFNMIKFVLHIAGIRGKFIEKGIRHHNCVTISQIITGKP